MTARDDQALKVLREVDAAASPGPWEAAPDFATTLQRLAEISPSLPLIPLTAPVAEVGKGYGVGWLRTEANARLASLAKGHLLRAMEALWEFAQRERCIACADLDPYPHAACVASDAAPIFAALADAILEPEEEAEP